MGVQGLWQLLQPAGQPVTLESLEGKVLAVDVSIWLHQTMKGMRDKDGHPLPNAHLQGLFSRVCKLLFYRIRPIFVFDGGVPALKKQTMAARRERRAEAERESTEISQKLLRNLMKSQAVRQTLGNERGSGRFVPGIRKGRGQHDSDMFELLPLTESEEIGLVLSAQEWEKDFELQENWIKEGLAVLSDTHPDSEEFRSLPMEIQHEALSEMKEQKKYHSLRRLTKMPEDSTDFSSYQLKKLMQQCKLTTRIEEVRKGMSSATSASLTRSEGDEYFGDEIESRRIVSEDSAHYVLIRGLTKKMQQEEADRYEIHNRVKLEKVEEEEGEDGTSVSEEKGHGSGRFSSDSDSDVESVLPRRLQRRRGQKSKSSRTATEYSGKLFAENKRTEVAVSGGGTSRMESTSDITCADSSSSSEDEGFIEIKFDPSAAAVDDDLFPASIFQTQTAKNEGEVKTSSASETLNREKVVHESLDKTEISGCFKRNRADVSPDLQTARSTEGSDRLSGDITCDTSMSETAADTPQPLSATEDISVKRKSVLNEILSQIEEKKRRLNDSSQIDDCVDIVDVEVGTVSKISSVFVSENTMGMQKEMAKIESSTSDVKILKPEASFQNHVHGGKRTSADSDLSDSDEDLKIAIELSLQTVRSEDEAASKCYKSFDTAPSQVREDLSGSAVAGEESIVGTVNKSLKESSHSDDQQPNIASSDSDNGGDDFEEVGPDLFITENPSMFKKTGVPVSSYEAGLQEDAKGADHEIMPVIGEISDKVDDNKSLDSKESYVSQEPERHMKILPDRTQPEDYEDGVGSIFQVMNEDELEDISTKLESERSALMSERGRHTREAVSVNDQTIQEAQELLRLFGIPFIVSPLEAESQCAYLDLTDQTEGTITDDSDIWLFGGRRTYKNFFNQNKNVEFFTYDNIHKHFGLNREQLINIALLCGSDYTEGIQGVGSVRALEIMAEFPGDGVEGLRMFRKWWDRAKKQAASVSENRIRAHLKDLKVISGFPSQAVVDAYLHPQVDDSKEKFTWSTPDLNMLRDFAKYKFGWSTEKSDQSLLPMMKQLSKKETQHRIDSYFQPQHLIVASKIKSKRLEKALALVKNLQVHQQGEQADDGVEKADESNQQEILKRKKRVEDCEEDGRICSAQKVRVHESEEGKVNLGTSSVVSVDTAQTENGLTKVQQMVKKDVKRRVPEKQKGKLGETVRRNKKQTTQKSRTGPCVNKKGKADKGVTQVRDSRVEEKQVLEGKGLLLKNEIEEEASIFHAGSQGHPDMGNESEVNQAKQRSLGKNIKSKEVKGDDHGKRWGKVLVSLDQKHRTRASRPLRLRQDQHRVGRAAMNLSESSSSSDDDGDDDDDSRCAQKITSELGHDHKHQLSTGTEECDHKGETTQLKALKMARIVENKGSQRKNPPSLGYSYKGGHEQQENETSRSQADSQMTAGTKAREKKVKKSPRSNDRLVHRADSVSDIGDKQKVKKTKEQGQHSQKHETALPAGPNFGKSSTEPKQDQMSVTAGRVSDEMLPSVIEKLTKPDQDIQTSQAEKVIGDEDTTVDITKADVSLINKQNLPSTLAYLNHRSRKDRLLLQQLRGGRNLNAVEKRLEESKGRLGQEKQKIDRPTQAMKQIISFEEMLGSFDAESSKSNQGKGRKPPAEIKSAKTKEKPAERSPSRFLHNSGQPGTGMDGPAAESCFSTTDPKQFSEKIPENLARSELKGVCGRSNSTNRSFEQDGTRTNFRQTDMIENDLTTFKSYRSKAFDRPIDEMYSDSSDDTHGNGGSGYRGKKKFLKQMEHLGESRSVKGHGPLPLQSAGKAFAGKGKGKGKNRAYLKEALDGGHVDVMKSGQAIQDEVNEYALVTEEDLGSDFSD